MRVLWLCNIMLPQVAAANDLKSTPGGGWLVGLSEALSAMENIRLLVCFPREKGQTLKGKTGNYEYRSFHQTKDSAPELERILREFSPDVIHIFGTEYKHSLDMVLTCEKMGLLDRTVISIQGLVSVIARHYCAFLPQSVTRQKTLRDILKGGGILSGQRAFCCRGAHEIAALEKAHHVIGRTDWDRACVQKINPAVQYHFCNETLRPTFYQHQWSFDQCEKHSIFVSQCSYPVKGFHLMLEAMTEIVRDYPDAMLYTTGRDPLHCSVPGKLRQTYYSKYIGKLIRQYGLENHVRFLGTLDEEQMCRQYLRSNVFASCSSIENSPNSLGEAMLLGVPSVASDVGGVKNMLTHGEEGFVYQADAPYMLAYYVKKLFGDPELQTRFSQEAKQHAVDTHNEEKNQEALLRIYKEVSVD